MSEEKQSTSGQKPRYSDAELRALKDTDGLTIEELQRFMLLQDIAQKKYQGQLAVRQIEEFQMKDAERRDKFYSRGRELQKTDHDHALQQGSCSHRKGGRGLDALIKGGNAPDYAVIRHLLPTNEWWSRCQRCGKTWRPPHEEDFDLKTSSGREAFERAKLEYKTALEWPTDNIPLILVAAAA
jgi:hypothetical protein